MIPPELDEQSLLLFPNDTKTSIAVKTKFGGKERVENLVVKLSYQVKDGQTKQI